MTQNILIKKSLSTSSPTSLEYGEPAVSFTGGKTKLFVGNSFESPQEVTAPGNIVDVTPSTSNAHRVLTVKEDKTGCVQSDNSIIYFPHDGWRYFETRQDARNFFLGL